MSWKRVRRDRPCPVCGKSDWCLVSKDGTAAICPRVESSKRAGEGGYLHRLAEPIPLDYKPRPWAINWKATPVDVSALARKYQENTERGSALEVLAERLGVTVSSLRRLGVGWSNSGFSTWPLCDSQGRIIGINRRFSDGSKRIMQGHRAGLYFPADLPKNLSGLNLLITEGGSDAAAGLDFGFWTVGRFSCQHGADLLSKLLRQRKPGRAIIVADRDVPGQRGAVNLAERLVIYTRDLRIIEPPTKDLRAWKQAGATFEDVQRVIEKTQPIRLHIYIKGL